MAGKKKVRCTGELGDVDLLELMADSLTVMAARGREDSHLVQRALLSAKRLRKLRRRILRGE